MGDLTARNREHFDQVASSHQNNWAPLIQAVIEELKERRSWISTKLGEDNTSKNDKGPLKLLDYACGSGTASKARTALAPYVDETVGLDLSENMVAEYNKWAEGQGYSRTKAHALQLDLLAEPQPTDLELSDFNVAAVCMALHHVADPPGLLRRLSKTLRPGGVCVVLDRVFQDERPELRADLPEESKKVLQTINKHGFTEEDMRQYFQGAGMGKNFEYVVIERPFKVTLYGHDMELKGFIARGEVA